jgi:dUTP pyrophosphatase
VPPELAYALAGMNPERVERWAKLRMPQLRVMRAHPDAKLPTYATEGSSGLDLYALEPTWLVERTMTRVRTGIAIELPDGYEAQVRTRSGLSCNGVHVAFGSIDSDYRGEVHVIATVLFGQTYRIAAGDRIAQLVIAKCERVCVIESEQLSETGRGSGGFGSTGR